MCFVFSVASREKKREHRGVSLSVSYGGDRRGFVARRRAKQDKHAAGGLGEGEWRELTESERSGVEKDLMPSNLALWVGFCLA